MVVCFLLKTRRNLTRFCPAFASRLPACTTRSPLIYDFKICFFLFIFCSSRQFGAVGSRLTGAGWGGCTVSMVPVDKLERFLANVKEAYYRNDGQRLALEENSLFATNPGGGAIIVLEA